MKKRTMSQARLLPLLLLSAPTILRAQPTLQDSLELRLLDLDIEKARRVSPI